MTFMFYGVEFPAYFKNPRFVESSSGCYTISIDPDNLNANQCQEFANNGMRLELANLSKKVLEKLLGEKILPQAKDPI